MPTHTTALGISTHMGWAAVAVVRLRRGVPAAVRTFRLETARPGDREALEPYHVAGGFDGLSRVPRPEDPPAVIERGLDRQRRHTRRSLKALLARIPDWPIPTAGALFVGRGRPAPTLERLLASHAQIHVAEGEAVRESVRRALAGLNVQTLEIDARSLEDTIGSILERGASAADEQIGRLSPDNGGPWRKEERRCALAAWAAAS